MSLISQARIDAKSFISNSDEWGVEMTLTAPDSTTTTITGLFTKHHMAVDPESGMQVIGKNAHISFSESDLSDYPVRVSGEVSLKGHKVTVADSYGTLTYKIKEVQPDETLGIIVCILSDYVAD